MKVKKRYLLTLFFFVLLFSCAKDKKPFAYMEDKGEIFHTTYSIKYLHNESLKKQIEQKLQEFDNSLNPFKPSSVISKVNNNEPVVLDSFFVNVFNRAKEVSLASDGLFDVTLSPLINAWGFGFKNMHNVTDGQIDSLKIIVGYQKINLSEGRVIKDDKRVNINASAIAKGYSTDVIANLLEQHGIEHYMVEIGGEIRAKGLTIKGKCWQIAITQPMKEGSFDHQAEQSIIKLCNKSLATSGSFHNYYIKDGKKYAHTIDPRTGYPAENTILSATVIANDCMTADAFATVFMLADTLQSKKIAAAENLEFMLILGSDSDDFNIVKTIRFDDYIVK